ncbi:MAG TPA: ribonuclease HI [Thermodesulfovibrionales bacterium]|nr:ribonuclease HI [Thermodesulfovibrionales bacterium]
MKEEEKPFVEVFTDGACSGNPGVGGYGVILRSGRREKELSGCESMTTNNRMELTAVLKALEALKKPCRVKVVTDSNYVVKGMTTWIHAWIRNSWKNSQKQDVMNKDLWEQLLKVSKGHDITWEWVKGHNEHAENERCDSIARLAIQSCKKG